MVRVGAVIRLLVQQQFLVTPYELGNIRNAPVGNPFGSEPKRLAFNGRGHEGAYGPSATEILVRLGHEGLDPGCNGAKGFQIAFRELPCPARVLDILEKEEIADL